MGAVLKVTRVTIGVALMVFSFTILLAGGFTRASIQYGFPSRPHWGVIAIGLVVMLCGAFLVRPPNFLRNHSV